MPTKTKTAEVESFPLPGIPFPPKQRGRKPLGEQPMTPAQRKARSRVKGLKRVLHDDPDLWTEDDCLMVLARPVMYPKMGLAAWRRLGQLRDYKM